MLVDQIFRPDNGDGWCLEVTRYHDTEHLEAKRRPVLMIPGYAMNTFILNFHPTGDSMVAYLCREGFEVWTANLRGQGGSTHHDGREPYGFRQLSLIDFPIVKDLVLDQTQTTGEAVHAVGCSLGASVLYAYLAHHRTSHDFASMIAIGGPLRWDEIHPAVELAFKSPMLASSVPFRGTRTLARTFMPVLKRMPWLLSIYMNVDQIDLTEIDTLVETVDDPNPYLNRQISHWIEDGNLKVAGLDVTEALRDLDDFPVMCILASADGIVPAKAAKSVCSIVDGSCVDVLEVGTEEKWYAHADLFISRGAQEKVFAPMADWLRGIEERAE